MDKTEIQKKAIELAEILRGKGVNSRYVVSLLSNNPELLEIDTLELKNQLYILSNNNKVYAVLLIRGNDYFWSVLVNEKFGPFVRSTANKNNNDYIIEMMIEAINKYYKYDEQNENQTLEQKAETFRTIKKNEEGYHLR